MDTTCLSKYCHYFFRGGSSEHHGDERPRGRNNRGRGGPRWANGRYGEVFFRSSNLKFNRLIMDMMDNEFKLKTKAGLKRNL